ncbi:MAG: elongation factor Ts [Armatimonadetes bacterium]|nr:elongation factor Ts [Armatimonadota bacterium]
MEGDFPLTISIDRVKELREKSGAGIMECRQALLTSKGDLLMAIQILKEKGLKEASKKSGRIAVCGKVEAYIHLDGKIGVLLELNCETDFVAKTEEFKNLAKELALQIAAFKPEYVSRDQVPQNIIDLQKTIYYNEAKEQGKTSEIINKIVAGKLDKFYQSICLLEQPYIRDENIKVNSLINEVIAKLRENILISRFVCFILGGK